MTLALRPAMGPDELDWKWNGPCMDGDARGAASELSA
jgi:hypothetical protein